MKLRQEFGEEEWKLIVAAPAMTAIAIAAASPSGPYGLMKEMMSVSMALQEIVERGSSNGLINALIEDIKERRTRGDLPLKATTPDEAKKLALNHLRSVAEMLYRKPAVSDTTAEEFKRWLVSLAQRVAEAASEGGFLGFGGEQISDDERAMLRQIAFALGLPSTSA